MKIARTLQRTALAALALGQLGCEHTTESAPAASISTPAVVQPPGEAPAVVDAKWIRQQEQCAELIEDAQSADALEGAPRFEANRALILGVAQGEPNYFVQAPTQPATKNAVTRAYRKKLFSSTFPNSVFDWMLPRLFLRPEMGRDVLLSDGYLYAEYPELAHAMTTMVELKHLFKEKRIWIQRGQQVFYAERQDARRRYLYTQAPPELVGKEARIYFLDRVGVAPDKGDADIPEPLHRDVREEARRLGFDRFSPEHVTRDQIVAQVRYGDAQVRTLFATEGAKVEKKCELIERSQLQTVRQGKALAERRQRVMAAMRHAMHEQIDAEVPFDEPRREWGQQDGHLRYHWENAYRSQESEYLFNFDSYSVYSSTGTPAAPQVCVDFITETLERASGTYYRPAGEEPGRVIGNLDFDEALPGFARRQVGTFLSMTQEKSSWFDVQAVPHDQQMPYKFKRTFLRRVAKADYRPGDIVLIRGYAPWDHYAHLHYHSFFIYESDPVSGMPISLVGNAGKPELRSWDKEMRRAPDRSIRYRIRPKLEWLESVLVLPEKNAPFQSQVRSAG